MTWTFQASTTNPAAAPEAWQPTGLMEKVARFLTGNPSPRSTIEKAGLGKQTLYVRQALDALIAGGYVTETAGPRGARVNTLVQPFNVPTSSSSPTSSPLEGETR